MKKSFVLSSFLLYNFSFCTFSAFFNTIFKYFSHPSLFCLFSEFHNDRAMCWRVYIFVACCDVVSTAFVFLFVELTRGQRKRPRLSLPGLGLIVWSVPQNCDAEEQTATVQRRERAARQARQMQVGREWMDCRAVRSFQSSRRIWKTGYGNSHPCSLRLDTRCEKLPQVMHRFCRQTCCSAAIKRAEYFINTRAKSKRCLCLSSWRTC